MNISLHTIIWSEDQVMEHKGVMETCRSEMSRATRLNRLICNGSQVKPPCGNDDMTISLRSVRKNESKETKIRILINIGRT